MGWLLLRSDCFKPNKLEASFEDARITDIQSLGCTNYFGNILSLLKTGVSLKIMCHSILSFEII